LIEEHEQITKALAILRSMAEAIERREIVPPEAAERLVGFFTSFVDQHHHWKEEQLLFPALVEAGLPVENGPVGVMLHEHDVGRRLVHVLRETAPDLDRTEDAAGHFAVAAFRYADLLENHIHKENGILFRLADQVLEPEQTFELQKAFQELEREAAASRRNVQHLRAVEELAQIFLDRPVGAAGLPETGELPFP